MPDRPPAGTKGVGDTVARSQTAKSRWGTSTPATENEIKVLGRVVSHLAELEPAARMRVFVYLRSLFDEWPTDND